MPSYDRDGEVTVLGIPPDELGGRRPRCNQRAAPLIQPCAIQGVVPTLLPSDAPPAVPILVEAADDPAALLALEEFLGVLGHRCHRLKKRTILN
jgi:hypothetical protein